MITIKAPHPIPQLDKPAIFLAGSIEMGAAENWQTRLEKELADLDIFILNPRRDDWDSSWIQSPSFGPFRDQVEWELAAMEKADCILFYFSPGTKAPITLLELGLWLGKCPQKIIVCCPEGYWRRGNVLITCNRYGVTVFDSIKPMVAKLKGNR